MKTAPDLPAFVARLERAGLLVRIARPTSLVHEITEIHRRVLSDGGPALLFERPVKADGSVSTIPVLVNLFGTQQRIELGFGTSDLAGLGQMLAFLPIERFVDEQRQARGNDQLGRCDQRP